MSGLDVEHQDFKKGGLMFGQLTFFSYFSPLEKLLSFSDLKVQSVALQSKKQRKTRFPLVLCSLIRNFAHR